jgi:calcineurin-like phosphoesterase family protein
MYYTQKFTENTYFIGCPHISHKNICKGVSDWEKLDSTRDFNTIEEMNLEILRGFNIVQKDDNLIILGDLFFGNKNNFESFMDQVICKNLYLILGNHDTWIMKDSNRAKKYFKWIEFYKEIQISKQHIVLFHYPISIFNGCHKGSWNICSHSHGTYYPSTKECLTEGKILDVGWDCFHKPVSFKEVKEIMDRKFVTNKDHHNKETT